jgi:hypothetical protein
MHWLIRVYAALLRLYPRHFRAEFEAEMQCVFAAAVNDAARRGLAALMMVCAREVWELPAALVREHRSSFKEGHMSAIPDTREAAEQPDAPATPAEALAGAGTFLLFPVVLAFGFVSPRLFAALNSEATAILSSMMNWIIVAVFMAMLIVAWRRGFPRWSFPLWALVLVFGPGDLWGLPACIPLAVVVVIAFAWTRSLRPFGDLIAGVGRDWTRLSFALYGFMPFALLVAFNHISGNEMALVALGGVLALGAFVHMRATRTGQRALALLVAVLICWTAATIFKAAYWSVPHEHGAAGVTPWASTVGDMLLMGGGWLAIMLSPALLELARRVDAAPHPA